MGYRSLSSAASPSSPRLGLGPAPGAVAPWPVDYSHVPPLALSEIRARFSISRGVRLHASAVRVGAAAAASRHPGPLMLLRAGRGPFRDVSRGYTSAAHADEVL